MNPLIQSHRAELADLCRRYRVRRLELFGSAADDPPTENVGDLDFLVEFQAIDPDGYAETYFGLLEAIEELFGRRIDLVMISAITNPYLLEDIARNRTVLYGARGTGFSSRRPNSGRPRQELCAREYPPCVERSKLYCAQAEP